MPNLGDSLRRPAGPSPLSPGKLQAPTAAPVDTSMAAVREQMAAAHASPSAEHSPFHFGPEMNPVTGDVGIGAGVSGHAGPFNLAAGLGVGVSGAHPELTLGGEASIPLGRTGFEAGVNVEGALGPGEEHGVHAGVSGGAFLRIPTE